MKAKRRIAWLLSFLMVFSLMMGTPKMQVFAEGAGKTATFDIRESNGQTGTVQYKLNESGDFITANNNTPVDLEGATSITIKVIPTGEAKVNQNYSGISGTEQTFDYDALIAESGWTYNIKDNDGNITFTIEFDNNDGTGGGSNPGGGENPGENTASYSVDFGEGSWIVGDVTVTADKSGKQTLSESDIITLTGFDAETMEARVDAEDGFGTTLTVTDGQTSISAHTNDGGVPTDITFSVVEKSSEPGGAGKTATFDIRESNGQTGTVQYKLNESGDFITANNNTPVDLEGATSITIKVIPTGEAKVNQNYSGISGTEQTFDYDALIAESGWTYNIQDNDGNITFTIEFDNNDGTGGGSNPGGGEVNNGNAVHANVTVNISGEELEYDAPWSNDAADFVFGINGSEMRRLSKEEVNYTTEGDKIVGLATKEALGYEYNYDDSGNVTFNIKTQWDDVITSLTINGVLYDTPQTKDDLINAFDADFRGIRFDIENVPYAEEYHIVVEGRKQTQEEKIMGNFGWTYDPNSNEYSDDDKIPYGNLEFVEAKYNGVTYDSIEEVNEAGGTFQWDDGVKGTDDPTGDAMFPTGTELTLRLIPDAGYQLTSLELNGTPFEPGEEVGLYTFTIGGGNWHLGAQFTQVGAEVQANSVNIKSGNIDINENFEYGTAKLEVSDVASMDSSRMEEFENTATDEGYEIENYLDISLYNAVYKGGIKDVNGNYESWDTSVENIENKAAITLELENDMSGKDLAVIHELHNGEEIIGYELINATYNEENNTITFESDSFSHYAIVSKGIGEDENVYHIDLGTGSWTVGDVIVSAPEGMSGVVPILDTEPIPTEMLANFDSETMDITLTTDDGFVIYLEIDENGNTTLASTRDGVELPPYGETLGFAVVEKSSNSGGGENPGENVYYIDLGIGSWTVGDVTVSTPEGTNGVVPILDTEPIPTEMLENFDSETMDITLTVSDGFVIYLEIDENGNTTLASTRDGVELPPYGETLTFAVVAKPGNMEIVDKTEENACNTDLAELTDDLISKLLTDAEKTKLENGEEVKVWLEATDISASVSQTDKNLIDSKKVNATIGMYLDIDLLKQIGSDSPVNITDTDGAVTITLKVPSSLMNSNSSVTRTYQMIRVHNGVATVIPCTYNAANQTISFETDQFSTYALAYVDQQNNSEGGNTGGSNDGEEGDSQVFEAPDIKVSYRTHIQTFGWEGKEDDIKTWKSNGTMSGTSGKSKRLEGINIVVNPTTACEDLDLGIQYTTHCQSYGWLPWSADGDMNGTEGEAKRLEAIMIQLTGEHAELYDVYYRVHAQTYGWLGWAKNGEPSGTAGYGKRLEGIQIVVVKKGENFDRNMGNITSKSSKAFEAKTGSSPIVNYSATSNTKPVVPGAEDVNVAYRTHVQSFGWQGWKYNGQMSGTSGLAKRLEGIEINITNKDYDGGVAYCTHVQTYGWQGAKLDDPTTWKQDGDMAGTSGQAKRLEAICITLTGEMAEHYDIYYRVHAQSYGWLGWASNGDPAGTAGYAKRLEGIQIVVVPKGEAGPAKTYNGITSVRTEAYVEK